MKRNIITEVQTPLIAAEASILQTIETQALMLRGSSPLVDMSDYAIARRLLNLKDKITLPHAELNIPLIPSTINVARSDAIGKQDKFVVTLIPYATREAARGGHNKVEFLWFPEKPAMDVDIEDADYVGESQIQGVTTYWFFHEVNADAFCLLALTGTAVRLKTYLYADCDDPLTVAKAAAQGIHDMVDLLVSQMVAAVALTVRKYNSNERGQLTIE